MKRKDLTTRVCGHSEAIGAGKMQIQARLRELKDPADM